MASLKTLNNTLAINSPKNLTPSQKTITKSGKSVIDKLKSLSQNLVTNSEVDSKEVLDKLDINNSLKESSTTPLLIVRYILVFLLVGFLLLNILASLGMLPNILQDFFKPILLFFGHSIGETVTQTTNITADGSKAVIDATSKTIDGAVDILEQKVNPNEEEKVKKLNHPENDITKKKAPEPDDSTSKTQLHRGSGKSGYCYIGEDRGFRSCIDVENDDECMSGKIFPTRDICINPTLRQ